nr:hypothetical protein [Pandoravirus aubagnensis]
MRACAKNRGTREKKSPRPCLMGRAQRPAVRAVFFPWAQCEQKDKSKKTTTNRIAPIPARGFLCVFFYSVQQLQQQCGCISCPFFPFFPFFCLATIHKDRHDIRAHCRTARSFGVARQQCQNIQYTFLGQHDHKQRFLLVNAAATTAAIIALYPKAHFPFFLSKEKRKNGLSFRAASAVFGRGPFVA